MLFWRLIGIILLFLILILSAVIPVLLKMKIESVSDILWVALAVWGCIGTSLIPIAYCSGLRRSMGSSELSVLNILRSLTPEQKKTLKAQMMKAVYAGIFVTAFCVGLYYLKLSVFRNGLGPGFFMVFWGSTVSGFLLPDSFRKGHRATGMQNG
jgi:hypothetical protein